MLRLQGGFEMSITEVIFAVMAKDLEDERLKTEFEIMDYWMDELGFDEEAKGVYDEQVCNYYRECCI